MKLPNNIFWLSVVLLFLLPACESRSPDYTLEFIERDGRFVVPSSQSERIKFDLSRPAELTEERLPLVILIHSGAFLTGSKESSFMSLLEDDLIRQGYAVAKINYHLISLTEVFDYKRSILEAIKETRAAVRYFHSKADEYLIDRKKIFLFGYSAGGILALNSALLDDYEAEKYFGVGCLDCLHVPGESGSPSDFPGVAGVISVSGAVFNINHVSPSKGQKVPPMLLIHGKNDSIVDPSEGKPFEKIVKEDIRLGIPGIEKMLRIKYDTEKYGEGEITGLIGMNFTIPQWMVGGFRDLACPDMVGSILITKKLRAKDCKLVQVRREGHFFMFNEDDEVGAKYKKHILGPTVRFLAKHSRYKERRRSRRE